MLHAPSEKLEILTQQLEETLTNLMEGRNERPLEYRPYLKQFLGNAWRAALRRDVNEIRRNLACIQQATRPILPVIRKMKDGKCSYEAIFGEKIEATHAVFNAIGFLNTGIGAIDMVNTNERSFTPVEQAILRTLEDSEFFLTIPDIIDKAGLSANSGSSVISLLYDNFLFRYQDILHRDQDGGYEFFYALSPLGEERAADLPMPGHEMEPVPSPS